MNQRTTRLARGLVAAGLLLLAGVNAGAFQLTDSNYTVLKPTQPTVTEVPAGRVEITEVFWYACGHCFAIEPKVQAWIKKGKPAYVNYVFMPATWNDVLKTHARIFFTIQLLGKPDLHDEVFREINVKRNMLDTPAKIEAFFVAHGVSKADFQKAFSSFAVESKLRQAEDLNRRYKITGTPTFVVNGTYVTDVGSAGSEDALFDVLGALAAKVKSGH
ncbi:MAG: thiol:disulfide interchange protein DsbA/DsbL [Steroidobacteraceae bacterium]